MRGTDETVARARANAHMLNTLAQQALARSGEQTDLFAHTDDDRNETTCPPSESRG